MRADHSTCQGPASAGECSVTAHQTTDLFRAQSKGSWCFTIMVLIRVQSLESRETFEVEADDSDSVLDLMARIETHSGVKASLQRLVLRGRLLPETEGVSTVAGSTIILIGTASREQHVTEVDTSDYACNAIGNEETSGEGFHVLVRCVDSQSHLNVRVAPETTTDELKKSVLSQLLKRHCVETEIQRYSFIFNGRVLAVGETLCEAEVTSGAMIVVIAPDAVRRRSAYPCSDLRHCCAHVVACLLGCLLWSRRLPGMVVTWVVALWNDPWSFARPRGPEPASRRPVVRLLEVPRRAHQYAPGNNPHGEDLTLILSQGLVG